MIFNCEACGKSISSKRDSCPYCKTDTVEFSLMLERKHKVGWKNIPEVFREKLRGTVAGLKL